MKLIAHRGNINGPNPELENKPEYIIKALEKYDCEIDLWLIKDKIFLGHDKPQYKIDINFLLKWADKLWCHCKNLDMLTFLLKYPEINCFWHQEDDYTITSKGYIWVYPGKPFNEECVIVSLNDLNKKCFGICSDYIV